MKNREKTSTSTTAPSPQEAPSGLEQTAVLDAFVHDKGQDQIILAMFETRPWSLGEPQLIQLQEKLNAYLSFILDGEMLDTFPHLKGKPVVIELRTLHEPSQEAFDFIVRIREQLHYQEIEFVVVLIGESFSCCCNQGEAPSSGCCQEPSVTNEDLSVPTVGCCSSL